MAILPGRHRHKYTSSVAKVLKNENIFFVSFVVLLSAVVLYGILIEPNQVEAHHIWIHNDALAHVLENRVVVQISDIHLHDIGIREKKVLELLEKLDPDILLLTGDYIPWKGDTEPALRFLSLLRAKIGVWAVMGDYDYSRSRYSCLFCHEEGSGHAARRHRVHFLKNTGELLHLPHGDVAIEGVDAEGGVPISVRVKKMIRPANPSVPAIMLSHSPLSFDLVGDSENILILAGDTHGGQVPLPAWLFAVMGYDKNVSYNQGFFQKGRKMLFVSRGIGTSHLPLRVFRPPEVAVFHFKKRNALEETARAGL
jgi:predicted MPP superfamily phosphohydrolase